MSDTQDVDFPGVKKRRPLWWRLLRWVLLGLVLLVVGVGVYLFFQERSYSATLARVMAELDRDDPNWQLEDIEKVRATVPDPENSALLILEIAKVIPRTWPEAPRAEGAGAARQPTVSLHERLLQTPPEQVFDAETAQDLRAAMPRAEEALKLARQLPEKERGRFKVDWLPNAPATLLPSQEARAVATLLAYDADFRAHGGDLEGALASLRGVVNCGRAIGDEPSTLSQVVHISCQAVAVNHLERVLAQGVPPQAALARMQRLLEEEAGQNLLLAGMRGERALSHRMIAAVVEGEISIGGGPPQPFPMRLGETTLFRRTHVPHVRMMTEYVKLARLPAHEQGAAVKKIEADQQDLPVMTALLVQPLARIVEASWRTQAQLRCAVTAVALERYRVANHKWPESLGQLVPGQLAAVPLDPYDGQPLRYARRADGVLVYSLGPDREDNRGARDREKITTKGTDIGFQLWEVAKRRQPRDGEGGKRP